MTMQILCWKHRTNWNSFHPQNEFIIILIFFWNLLKKDIRFFYIIQRMNGCIVLQKFFRHLLRISLVLLNKHLIQKITAPKTSFYTDAWEVLMFGKNVYFYKSFHTGSHYACCFIPADNIIQPLKNIIKEKDGFILPRKTEPYLLIKNCWSNTILNFQEKAIPILTRLIIRE